ncbi:dipeptidyl-peptidase [Flavobacteriaceae bacterium UJ101]|nr:dipeptidyl-peptidase [Flavobacteriaceae bacterium UJ101]
MLTFVQRNDFMTHGIINLSVVPIRAEASDKAEMVTQGLFGDLITVLEVQKPWVKVKILDDSYEGWMDYKQFFPLLEEDFVRYQKNKKYFLGEYITFAFNENRVPITLPLGVQLPFYQNNEFQLGEKYQIEADIISDIQPKDCVVELAHLYLNTPYLWGGKSIFGIDCSGFTQQVYKMCGIIIPRDAFQQAELGTPLSFIEEAEPGDLAFFDNEEGHIIHVGIVLSENRIIHAHGKVRIDHLDHSGIFNAEFKKHTHKLRVIKKIIE